LTLGSTPKKTTVPESIRKELGLVQVFTGDGKGKTSAAMGIVLRAAAYNLRVCVVFFMKGKIPSGEHSSLSLLPNVTILRPVWRGFVKQDSLKTEDKELALQTFEQAREAVMSSNYDIVVLDEINIVISFGLVNVAEVLKLIEDKPKNVELILTGRKAQPELIERADLVTEMRKVKHPYDKGTKARKGLDY
jgi:cob(I)alamin adenosyltransferase